MTKHSTLVEKIIADTKKYSPKLLEREYLAKAKILAHNLQSLESEILNDPNGKLYITRFNFTVDGFLRGLQERINRTGGDEIR